MNIKQTCLLWFIGLIVAQLVAWTLLPKLLLHGTYVDILENLAWGSHWQLGYDKDPFLGAWVTRAAYLLTGKSIWSLYLMSQISICLCFFATWQLAKRMLPPVKALLSVTLLIGIFYFSASSPEFNDNILELPLWAFTLLFFYDAVKQQTIKKWILTAIFAGLSLMAKYYSVMLLASMFIFLLVNPTGRRSFKSAGPYLCLIVFALIVMPNLRWLAQHNFVSIHYAFNRASLDKSAVRSLFDHILNPLHFLLLMIGMAAIPTVVYFACFKRIKTNINVPAYDKQFIAIHCFGPLALTCLFSFATGASLRLFWGTPLLTLFGIWLVLTLNPTPTQTALKRYGIISVSLFIFWLFAYVLLETVYPFMINRGDALYELFPGKQVAQQIDKLWYEHYQTPLKYVAGTREYVVSVTVFSKDHPAGYFEWNPNFSQWINEKDLRQQGAVFMWKARNSNTNIPTAIAKRFPSAKFVGTYQFNYVLNQWITHWINFKPIPPIYIGVALLPPQNQ